MNSPSLEDSGEENLGRVLSQCIFRYSGCRFINRVEIRSKLLIKALSSVNFINFEHILFQFSVFLFLILSTYLFVGENLILQNYIKYCKNFEFTFPFLTYYSQSSIFVVSTHFMLSFSTYINIPSWRLLVKS